MTPRLASRGRRGLVGRWIFRRTTKGVVAGPAVSGTRRDHIVTDRTDGAEILLFRSVFCVRRQRNSLAATACAKIVFIVQNRTAMVTVVGHSLSSRENKKVRQPKPTHRKAQTPIVAKQTREKTGYTPCVLTEWNLRFY